MALFPNEKPFTFEEGVESAEVIQSLDDELQNSPTGAHHSATWKDYDWSQAAVGGPNGDLYVIARPKNPAKHSPWVYDESNSGSWLENADWDPNTNQLDTSRAPVVSAANAPGPTPLQPSGGQPYVPGAPLPGQAGTPYIPGQAGVPMRMTGRQEEKVDPGNIGKMKETGFDDALDKLLGGTP